ncbi:MAG: peptide/nickel transport system permease protein [Acidimicrobiaceae bacterium]|nr:peptide/nickel transport system permease protein [Acidimicrobiaceae bacterium]
MLASIAVFTVIAVLPGDPAEIYAGTQATPNQVATLRKDYGLDASIPVRYGRWVSDLVRGDLGQTFISKRSIASEIGGRLDVTLPLVALSMLIALAIALPFGVLSAIGHRRATGAVISTVSQIGIAIPAFWAGLMLISLVAVRWKLLPGGGFTPWGDSVWGAVRSLILPALSLAIVVAAVLTRYVRSAVLDVLREDYIRTARAKGLTLRQALVRHGLRNASLPVVTLLGLQLSALLVGAVVIENVFTLPGLGKLLLDNINSREIILIQDLVMLLTVVTLAVNLVVDLLQLVIDPRLRRVAP